jgi:DNA-binding transcriptional ArsR family regulator
VNELGRAVGLATGALMHHTQKLEAAGLLVSVPDGNRRRFYPPGTRAGGRNPLHEEILRALAQGERDAAQLARELGVSRQALHYHVRRLARDGAVLAQRRGRDLVLTRSTAA